MSQTKAQLLDNIKDNVQLDARNALRFADTDSSHYVAFKAPATVSSNVTWTLPAADGSANYVLATDGSGTLSWIADPAGQWVTSGSNIYFTGGNVGIGDSSPSNPLSVTGASAFNGDVTFTGASYSAVWDKSDNALEFADSAKAAFGADQDLTIHHDGTDNYVYNNVTNLFFRSANNDKLISLINDGEVQLYFDNSEKLNTVTDGINLTGSLQFADDTNTHLSHPAADTLAITTGGTERLRADSNGNIGIGVNASSGVNLHVKDSSGDGAILLEGTSSTLGSWIQLQNNDNTANAYSGIYGADAGGQGTTEIRFINVNDGNNEGELRIRTRPSGGSLTDRLTIDSSGNVNINTTTAIGKLTLRGTNSSGSAAYGLTNSGKASQGLDLSCSTVGDGNFGGAVSFGCGGNGRSGIAAYQDGADDDKNGLVFLTHESTAGSDNAVERMRIHANGQTSIGTTAKAGYDDRPLSIYHDTACYLEVRTDAGDYNSGVVFSKGSAADSDSYRGYIAYNHSTDRMTFHTGGGTRRGMFDENGLHFDTNNNTAATGLDDYEEGVFTPYIGGTTNHSTYNQQGSGHYLKVGKLVYISIRFNGVDLSDDAAGNVKITGLPFTNDNSASSPGTNNMLGDTAEYNTVRSSTYWYNWYASGTEIYALLTRNSNTWQDRPISDFHGSPMYMNLSGVYRST